MSSLLRVAILGLALVALLISFSATEDIPGVPKTDLNAIRERTYLSDDEAEMAKINEQIIVGKFWIQLSLKDPAPPTLPTPAPQTSPMTTEETLSNSTTGIGNSTSINGTTITTTEDPTTTTSTTVTTTTSTTTTTTTSGSTAITTASNSSVTMSNGTASGNGSSANSSNSTGIEPFADIDSRVQEALGPDQKIRSNFCRMSKLASGTNQYCSYLLYGHDFMGFWKTLRLLLLTDEEWEIDDYDIKTYTKVKKNTVFQTYMVLYDTKYMPQFSDLNNSATLKISNDLMLLSRPMMKNRFGEFFFRTVVLGYYEDPLTTFAVANMAFLVEPGERNFMDFYGAWINQRDQYQSLGSYRLESGDFRTYHIEYIPTEFDQFLILNDEESRAALTLDTLANLTEVGIPSFVVLAVIILVIVVCAWEGWCCKRFIEIDSK
ncbi:uncharacterized protein LOC131877143 [Tigriopus californicus]|uniref:uncharacterized protein LOC131877143 n=1 Tax=Tigriopus californicus TaxID=6832 RepID=UPI0027DA51B2|nr:uncharacterized protein LOC131877143 [Tigriopus californicus]